VAFLTTVVGGPAHLAGHSLGGATALHVALRYPGLVRRLILIRREHPAAGSGGVGLTLARPG